MRYKQKIFPEEIRLFGLNPGEENINLKQNSLSMCREITFQITTNCNLSCDYCYECNKDGKVMSLETAKKICDLLCKELEKDDGFLGKKYLKGLVIEFIGGEPLLYTKLISDIINYLFSKIYLIRPDLLPFIKISITTNGVNFLNKDVQDFLKKYQDMISLTVSIDGVKELHDAHRVDKNGNGSFDKAFLAFQNAKTFGWNNSKMTFVPESLNYIYDSIIFMINQGIEDIFCNFAYEPYYTEEDGKLLFIQLKKVADFIFENKRQHLFISFLDIELGNKNTNKMNYCGGTGNMLSFDPDGKAYPCLRYHPSSLNSLSGNMVIGDFNGIFETKQSLKIKDYLESITYDSQSPDKCISCPISQGCGWCSAYNYQATGDVNKRVTNICNVHKARVLAYYYYINIRSRLWKDCFPQEIKIDEKEALKFITEDDWKELNYLYELAKESYLKDPKSYNVN